LLIFAGRDIAYVDALFFATGACTQAGLNVIDVNLLNTWQQVIPLSYKDTHATVLYLLPCMYLQRRHYQHGRGRRPIILVYKEIQAYR
jgi:hypothetical protein